jgi:hypothetical protein
MAKKEPQVVKKSHVPELCKKAGWDFAKFESEAKYRHGISLNTAKKAFSGATNLDEKVVIALARLFGCSEPYREILEIRLD